MGNFDTLTVILIVVFFGIVLGIGAYIRRSKQKKFRAKYGEEYDLAMEKTGSAKKAQTELRERKKHYNLLNIRPLTDVERGRYRSEWTDVQSSFVDEPGKAIGAADRLIIEVMQKRDYPLSDFAQRAADVSIKYPELVKNYRAAREIAMRNTDQKASTEELRQAMIHYHSLFEELVGTEASAAVAA